MSASRVLLIYREHEALPADGRRYEIHDGELSARPAPSPQHQRVSRRGIEGALTLGVEVLSPSTTLIDRSTTRQLYAGHRVPFYWLVDPEDRAVEALVLAAAGGMRCTARSASVRATRARPGHRDGEASLKRATHLVILAS